MKKEKEYREKRIHIVDWPDIERRMGIVARMTSDPPLLQQDNEE
ncbi:MAG: hypothetical protein ACFFCP_08080 [Promethearchaeota archaeon]